MTSIVEIFVGMLLAVVILALLARRFHIPYPIFFVIGGTLLGFVPGAPRLRMSPDLVFLVVLPPLLYPAAAFTSWRDFRANLRSISMLAIGLVLFTTTLVAYLAQYFLHLPLAAGFVLGAIVSPPDAIAATAIAKRLRIPGRIVTILEGESLVNDATALVAYRLAVAAVATGIFSWGQAAEQFVIISLGGVFTGLAVGWLAEQFHRRVDDAPVEITVSLLTPYAAYLLAEHLQVSGVLAVVTTGLYMGWRAPEITSFQTRLRGGPVWEMLIFLLNGLVFILIGLQLPDILQTLAKDHLPARVVIEYAVIITLAVIVIRILWVFPAVYLPRLLFKQLCRRDPRLRWEYVAIVAWTGMRGVVSLAAAMALPLTKADGTPFPGRDLILFITFVIIFTTLVVQGLSLPPFIRWAGLKDDGTIEREERLARLQANQQALAMLQNQAEPDAPRREALDRLRAEYMDHIAQMESTKPEQAGEPLRLFSTEYQRLSREALQLERRAIIQLRNAGTINDEVLRRIVRDIDLAEARLKQQE
jgi:CPA1 family monovalent cation:H+ antiporter